MGEGGLGGPGADLVQGLGIEQSVGDEDLDEVAQWNLAFPRDSGINSSAEMQSVAEAGDDGQGSDPLGGELRDGDHLKILLGTRHVRTFRDWIASLMPPAEETRSSGCGKGVLSVAFVTGRR